MGWIYGLLESTLGGEPPIDADQAAIHPYTGFLLIHQAAMAHQTITPEIECSICAALEQFNPDKEGESPEEPPQPLANQGAWLLGRYQGKSGSPIQSPPVEPEQQSTPEPPFDIKAARRVKGMTQKDLAAAMGVYPNDIYRWETGKFTPRPDTLRKIKEILK